jgi:hypothetical protein
VHRVLVLQLSSPKTLNPRCKRVLVLQLRNPKTLNPRCKGCWLPFFSSRLVSPRHTTLVHDELGATRKPLRITSPAKIPELERFFWGKKRTESFLFPFLISKKKKLFVFVFATMESST